MERQLQRVARGVRACHRRGRGGHGELSVAVVWRLRGVSRAFRGWCGSVLEAMPRVVHPHAEGGDGHAYREV